jgi:molybdopterin converting factor small subunit
MRVRVLPFGVSKDWLGRAAVTVELPEGASVAYLLEHLAAGMAGQRQFLRGIAVSVNAEYAAAGHLLRDGDEVGLLPPVSGGTARMADASDENPDSRPIVIALTQQRIEAEKLVAAAKRARMARSSSSTALCATIRAGGRRCIWTTKPTKRWRSNR